MSFWDDVGHVFESAGKAVAQTMIDGAKMTGDGWKSVFHGDVGNGLAEAAGGMMTIAGLLPPQVARQYEDAQGNAALWASKESLAEEKHICYSRYHDQVIANMKALDLTYKPEMDASIRQGAQSLAFINLDC